MTARSLVGSDLEGSALPRGKVRPGGRAWRRQAPEPAESYHGTRSPRSNVLVPHLSRLSPLRALTPGREGGMMSAEPGAWDEDFPPDEEFAGGDAWGHAAWGWNAAGLGGGDMSWRRAVERFGYTEESRRLAYCTLGFVCHLLQDMGNPEHVHDDPHGASGYTGFARWVGRHWDSLAPAVPCEPRPRKFDTLKAFMENLALLGYSAGRFHGGESSPNAPYLDPGTGLGRNGRSRSRRGPALSTRPTGALFPALSTRAGPCGPARTAATACPSAGTRRVGARSRPAWPGTRARTRPGRQAPPTRAGGAPGRGGRPAAPGRVAPPRS